MSSPSPTRDSQYREDDRQQRLADLSGAMAVARLSHQVKELELQKSQHEKLTKPEFTPINATIDVEVLISSLDLVKRWTGDGGVNIIVPLAVLDELDQLKKGSDTINIKTREVIRYLDRRTKSSRAKGPESKQFGSLRMQRPEEMFAVWEECEKMVSNKGETLMSKDEIPRYARGIVNCLLYQRSQGNELYVITEREALKPLLEKWNIKTMAVVELESASLMVLENYRENLKAYDNRRREAERKTSAKNKTLWTPAK